MNKKGDIPSLLFAVIMLFTIGILFFFGNHVNNAFMDKFDDVLKDDYNNTVALDTLRDIQDVENSAWDYAFLAIMFGLFLSLILTAFATRISAAFYWLYGIISIIVLLTGTILSNMWQTFAANSEFAVTIGRFPIMDAILGSYYPMVVAGMIFLLMIILFGKMPERI